MKKIHLISLAAALCLCACGDKTSTDKTSSSNGNAPVVKDTLTQYLATARLITLADTVKEINEVIENHYTWMDAISACPTGYRLPTVEEYKKLNSRIAEFTRGDIWWTANVTENPDSTVLYASATLATLPEKGSRFQFRTVGSTSIAKVKCIQDTTGNKIVVNESTQKLSEMNGTVTGTTFKPYYETSLKNMGCSDCCCEEGNGGVLDVSIQMDSAHTEKFQIKELSESFCGALAFNQDNTPKEIQKASDGCTPAVLGNFNILQLFQPGVKVMRSSCTSPIYLMTASQQSRKDVTCGESIVLEFKAKVQDMSLAVNEDPEAEKECNYALLINDSKKAVTTKGTCSNAEIGKEYNLQVTITLDAVTSKEASPILQQEFPCCYGEVQSHQITNISFTPIAVPENP
ncbi:hypothetical protein [Fibrobacter sp. UWEL]|uniref:hypothetical protein n=1 Tax=Fibrobacter sp. UWEL TaxID=1896209 RepID=UPI0009180048|nr:hypothetical protein [Fibrobacter sp. UWEL]SHK30955.1 major paralogous domain-containing protein [Fibrobacter sp. UWEL]